MNAKDDAAKEAQEISEHPVVGALLRTSFGVFAVVDANRRVLAVNDSFLRAIGGHDADQLLGLRLGEVLECAHALSAEEGCGTTRACPSCGAALAVSASLATDVPVERRCALATLRGGKNFSLHLAVRALRFSLNDHFLVLLYLQDNTDTERLLLLERSFVHDLSNTVTILQAAAATLSEPTSENTNLVEVVIDRLVREVALQRSLLLGTTVALPARTAPIEPTAFLAELAATFATRRPLVRAQPCTVPLELWGDRTMIGRVLANFVENALDAAPPTSQITLHVEAEADGVRFVVHNEGAIPSSVVPRIFQPHFSTKEGRSRGWGTYCSRWMAEHYLHGSVGFETDRERGTRFWLSVPLRPQDVPLA